jgi:hypothetical protein
VDAKYLGGLANAFLEYRMTGQIRVRRKQDEQGGIVLEIIDGNVKYRDDANRIAAEVHVEPGTHVRLQPLKEGRYYAIDEGEVNGEASLHQRGGDHWIFKEKFQAEPEVTMQLSAEPGHDATNGAGG